MKYYYQLKMISANVQGGSELIYLTKTNFASLYFGQEFQAPLLAWLQVILTDAVPP